MNLTEILKHKSGHLVTTRASRNVLDAIRTMCDSKVGSLLVESDDGDLLGIITERDILRFSAENNGCLDEVMIDDVMTRDLIVATPECSVDEAMSLMTENRFRHLPIIECGKTLGMVSIGDLVKAKLKDVTVEVKYLRDYISA